MYQRCLSKPIANLTILTDAKENWRPRFYVQEFGTLSWEYNSQLIDYRNHIAEIEASTNPFAQVILAQLAALEKQDQGKRLISKIELTQHLYIKGWAKNDILSLYKFID